jgi:predicted DNA-binding protein (UPF0251 family)
MGSGTSVWTIDDVAERFREAVAVGRRLPPVRVQAYFSLWPPIVRQEWERYADEDPPLRRFPPEAAAVERMLETMQWIHWLEVEQRHLVWMRAKEYEWKHICRRLGCDRTTAWRHWKRSLQVLADRLNDAA